MSLQSDLKNLSIKDAKNGDWKQAIEHNNQILELSPENTNALNRLGIAYVQVGKISKAKKSFKQALDIDKNNKIAKKHLEKLANNQTCVAPSFSNSHFIEEPGKTRTVSLFRLAGKNVLDCVGVGKECELIIKNRFISIEIEGKYIGALPEDLSFRLTKLIKSGNEYQCIVRSSNQKNCEVFLKETLISKKNVGTHSFPPSKMSLNPLSQLDEAVVLEENLPVEMLDTDNDTEKTIEFVDHNELN
jgi:tetratricopeptide (TPR) repeat protein